MNAQDPHDFVHATLWSVLTASLLSVVAWAHPLGVCIWVLYLVYQFHRAFRHDGVYARLRSFTWARLQELWRETER